VCSEVLCPTQKAANERLRLVEAEAKEAAATDVADGAKAHGKGTSTVTSENGSPTRTHFLHALREEASPDRPRASEVASGSDSPFATPETPAKAVHPHLVATDGEVSTDGSESESAEHGAAECLQGTRDVGSHNCQSNSMAESFSTGPPYAEERKLPEQRSGDSLPSDTEIEAPEQSAVATTSAELHAVCLQLLSVLRPAIIVCDHKKPLNSHMPCCWGIDCLLLCAQL